MAINVAIPEDLRWRDTPRRGVRAAVADHPDAAGRVAGGEGLRASGRRGRGAYVSFPVPDRPELDRAHLGRCRRGRDGGGPPTSDLCLDRPGAALPPGRCLQRRAVARQPARGRPRRRRADRRADGAVRALDEPLRDHLPVHADRPGRRLPGADLDDGGELPFAGHPTIGSAHAWLEAGGVPRGDAIVQECGAGLVDVRRSPRLGFAAPPLRALGAGRGRPAGADRDRARHRRRRGRRTWRGSTTAPAGSASTSARPRPCSPSCPTSPPSPTSR